MPTAVTNAYSDRVACLLFQGVTFGRTMAAMEFYIDESGTERVFLVAGYLATEVKWRAFSVRWQETLERAEHYGSVDGNKRLLPFHMTDYENRQPPYDSWDDPKRVRVICELIDVINETVDCALICRMPLVLFEAAFPPSLRKEKSFLYMACFHSVYMKLFGLAKINSLERVPLVFDRNREVSGHVKSVDVQIRKLVPEIDDYLGALAFEDKRHFLPLQAADVLAYEAMKNADNIVLNNGYLRRSFQRLSRQRYGFHDHDEESIKTIVKQFMAIRGPEEWMRWLATDA